MKTLKTVAVVPVFVAEGPLPDLKDMQDGKIYISRQYSTSIHRCLCGCGREVVIPFGVGSGWQLTSNDGKISIRPSIGNYVFSCQSHYVITNNKANFI